MINRKTLSLLFFLFSISSIPVLAQTHSGIRGGLNISNLYVNNVSDENAKLGFNVGIYSQFKVTDIFSIEPEINYSLKGSQITYNNIFGGSGKYKYNLSYIDVPIHAMFTLGKLNLYAGPYAGILLGAKVKDVDGDGSVNGVTQLDRDYFNTFDAGVSAGIGFDINAGSVGIRYNYGIIPITDNRDYGVDNGKNSVLQFYIGFDF